MLIGWIPILMAAGATYLFWQSGDTELMRLAIAAAIGGFWSLGILYNFRGDGFAPVWPALLNMVCTIASIVLLIVAVV